MRTCLSQTLPLVVLSSASSAVPSAGGRLPRAEQHTGTCLDRKEVLGCGLKSCWPELQFFIYSPVKRPW